MQDIRQGRSAPAEQRTRRRRLGFAALAVASMVTLAACGQSASGSAAAKNPDKSAASETSTSPGSGQAAVTVSPVIENKGVIPAEPVTVKTTGGKLTSVSVTAGGKSLDGTLSADGTSWVSSHDTEYGVTYSVKAQFAGGDGGKTTRDSTFTTLSKEETFVGTYNVNQGSTVGVALPVSIVFNKAIKDKAAVERALKVTSSPAVEGAWSWMKDRDGKDRIDYRPQEYWKPATKVTLGMNLAGVTSGDAVGIQNRQIDFTVGKAVVSTVDVVKKTMTVSDNGKVLRTLPVSTGKETFETWNGTMVVLSKVPTIRMDSSTVGIFGPEAYDLGEVKWDVQLSISGTYAHAAPWNEGKFGRVNASHGCIGMSTDDAKWFFDQVNFGDPVTVVNSTDTLAVNNGYGAWNVDWATWQKGSALK